MNNPDSLSALREALVEAIGIDTGWEESAVHMVDNVVLPIICRYKSKNADNLNTSESDSQKQTDKKSVNISQISILIEKAIADAFECSLEHRDYRLEKAVKSVSEIISNTQVNDTLIQITKESLDQ